MKTKYRWQFCIGLFLSAFTSGALLILPMLSKTLIDEVIIAQNKEPLLRILVIMLTVHITRLIARYYMVVCLEKSSQSVLFSLRKKLFTVLQNQEMRFFDRNRTGDLMTRLSADLDWCRHFMAYLSYNVIDCIVMFASTLILFFIISWKLTLMLIAVTPLLMIVTKVYSDKVRPLFVDMRERLSEMNTAAQENISGNRVVKAFTREDYEKVRFQKKDQSFRDANLDINKMWLSFFPFIELLANFMTLITVFVGGLFIIQGEITSGELFVFTSLAWALANPMRNLGPLINDLQRFYTSSNKIIEIFYSRPLIVDHPDALDHSEPQGKITFRDVSFSHGKVKVLDHISFEVLPGQTLAIMGPTGSGKTTIINLLDRFYDVDEGEILVDDCNVRLWKLSQLRRCIGTATQDVFLVFRYD